MTFAARPNGYSALTFAPVVYSTAGAFTETSPAGATSVVIELYGGGGGGGRDVPGGGTAVGGGGGAYLIKTITGITGGVSSWSGTVAASSGFQTTNGSGLSGNATTITSPSLSAGGGQGGVSSGSGVGGTATGGDTNTSGATVTGGVGGTGAGPLGGAGGNSATAGTAPGGGGGAANGASGSGGSGAIGRAIFTYS